MTHDPFCPIVVPHMVNLMCLCDVLTKVRADEREKAAPIALEHGKTYVIEVPLGTSPLNMEIVRRHAAEVAPECKFIVLAGGRIAQGGEQV